MLDLLLQPARACFCEQPLPGPIRHPADTWTNIGPIVAGILVMCRAQTGMLMLLGASAVWMGAMSAVFHATGSLGGEALDLHGMYLFLSMMMCCQVRTWGGFISTSDAAKISFTIASLTAFGFLYLPWLGTPIFALLVIVLLVNQSGVGFNSQWYWMMGTFAVAYAVWLLDYHRILCSPSNHVLTGHGVWHLLNGVIVWQAFKIFESANDSRRGYGLR